MSLKRLGKCTEQPVLSLEGMTNEPLNLVKHVQDATVDTKISKLKRRHQCIKFDSFWTWQ
jgi:hypothetical protein